MIEKEQIITDTTRQPDDVSTSNEAPVIPPRPFRPPRPFPPGKGGHVSSGRSKGTRRKTAKELNGRSVENTNRQEPSFDLQPNTDLQTQMRSDEALSEVVASAPPIPSATTSQDFSQAKSEEPNSESLSTQGQLNVQTFEEPATVEDQPSSSVGYTIKNDQPQETSNASNFDEEGDQVRKILGVSKCCLKLTVTYNMIRFLRYLNLVLLGQEETDLLTQ